MPLAVPGPASGFIPRDGLSPSESFPSYDLTSRLAQNDGLASGLGNESGVAWPALDFDLKHTGANRVENTLSPANVSQLTTLWSTPTVGGVTDSIALVNGTAYFGDWSGSVYAVNAYTGQLEWKTSLGGPYDYTGCSQPGIASTATVSNNTVYIGGSNPWEYALNASTGAVLWHVDLANYTGASSPWTAYKAWSSALVVNGYLYVGTSSGCDSPLVRAALLQISLATHTIAHIAYLVNATDLGNSIWSSPSYDAQTNTVWATTGNGLSDLETYARAIMAFNASNVSQIVGYAQEAAPFNDYDFGDGVTIFHTAGGIPMVVALNKNGYAYAFNLTTFHGNVSADPAWTLEVTTVPGESYSPPAFDGQTLYFGSVNTSLPNGTMVNGTLRAVDPSNGSTKWLEPVPYAVFGGTTYADGLVVAGVTGGFSDQRQGALVIVNASDGQPLYTREGGAIWGEPIVANGEIVFGSGPLASSGPGQVTALALPLNGTSSAAALTGRSESTYRLNALPTGGVSPYNFTWTFGDGAEGLGAEVTHGYAHAGQFDGSLTIRDAADQTFVVVFVLHSTTPPPGPTLPLALVDVLGGAAAGIAVGTVTYVVLRRRRSTPHPGSGLT
jgi:outer membrane protein assembly factor BamB